MSTALVKSELFIASRWTAGNLWFPTQIEVNADRVTRIKRGFFSSDEETMSMQKIASVHIKTGLIWSEIRIESSGGADAIRSVGHSKADAKRIRALIEDYQSGAAVRQGGSLVQARLSNINNPSLRCRPPDQPRPQIDPLLQQDTGTASCPS